MDSDRRTSGEGGSSSRSASALATQTAEKEWDRNFQANETLTLKPPRHPYTLAVITDEAPLRVTFTDPDNVKQSTTLKPYGSLAIPPDSTRIKVQALAPTQVSTRLYRNTTEHVKIGSSVLNLDNQELIAKRLAAKERRFQRIKKARELAKAQRSQ